MRHHFCCCCCCCCCCCSWHWRAVSSSLLCLCCGRLLLLMMLMALARCIQLPALPLLRAADATDDADCTGALCPAPCFASAVGGCCCCCCCWHWRAVSSSLLCLCCGRLLLLLLLLALARCVQLPALPLLWAATAADADGTGALCLAPYFASAVRDPNQSAPSRALLSWRRWAVKNDARLCCLGCAVPTEEGGGASLAPRPCARVQRRSLLLVL